MSRFRDRLRDGRPMILAHRGASAYAPENTMDAARLGYRQRADAWELDVQITRDLVPIVIHDASLVRTTDVRSVFGNDPRAEQEFRVCDFDSREIATLDAGSWFVEPDGAIRSAAWFGTLDEISDRDRAQFSHGKVRVPSLIEALAWTKEVGWLVNVELKSSPRRSQPLIERVLKAIDETDTADRVLISSFEHRELVEIRRLREDLALGALIDRDFGDIPTIPAGMDALHPSPSALGVPADETVNEEQLRARIERIGQPVLVWTVNEIGRGGRADQLVRAGVSGIFTDKPGELARTWGRSPENGGVAG